MHYKANVNHWGSDCFKYFDDNKKMYEWISERIGENVSSFNECQEWNLRQHVGIAHTKGYIDIYSIQDIKDYYKQRRAYITKVRQCEDLLCKVQKVTERFKRSWVMASFSWAYQDAEDIRSEHPQVWQGEI